MTDYQILTILAAIAFLYNLVASRLERTPVNGALVYVAAGLPRSSSNLRVTDGKGRMARLRIYLLQNGTRISPAALTTIVTTASDPTELYSLKARCGLPRPRSTTSRAINQSPARHSCSLGACSMRAGHYT